MSTNKTIVYFHTGRGGRFNNGGHTTFNGTKTIEQVLQMNDSGRRHSYPNKENQQKIYDMLYSRRSLSNILELFLKCTDNDDFSEFEAKSGLEMGEDVYTDCNGSIIITAAELETGVGTLDWDREYDTDCCMLLSDCQEEELKQIIDSNEWDKESLIQEYFNDNTDLKIDWSRFDGRYLDLIDEYFNGPIDIEDFYEEKN